jgi:hypothetical protein
MYEFEIHFTSGWYHSGYDYEGDTQDLANKLTDLIGRLVFVHVEEVHHPRQGGIEPYRSFTCKVKFDTLDGLLKAMERSGYEWVMHSHAHGNSIEIYDDYRE